MLCRIGNSTSLKILWGIMGLYFLNISVDSADIKPQHIPEDLSINDQESIIEIFVEKVLGYEDAIKEHDDHDPEDHNTTTNSKVDLISRSLFNFNFKNFVFEHKKQRFPDFSSYPTVGFYDRYTPPPEN